MDRVQVWKFGGTSVGTPQRMKEVGEIIGLSDDNIVVVLSAVSGATNALEALNGNLSEKAFEGFANGISAMESHYGQFITQLYQSNKYLELARSFIAEKMTLLRSFQNVEHNEEKRRIILSQGELISTQLFYWYMLDTGREATLLPALDFMRIDKMNEPDEYYIKSMLAKELQLSENSSLYITQGYICRNAFGEIDNLKRGGSDFTATLLGQALDADCIQIWTDIDGLHNNDPRVVEDTFPIQELSYDEAAELAYFGAKILHPSCVLPAQRANVPIYLKNTMDPSATGTIISSHHAQRDLTAIAAKDNITAVKIKSGRMLMAYGFLKRVFEVFERYETPIDMITTSEVAVSLTIDDESNLTRIMHELRSFGEVQVDHDLTIVCIVGNFGEQRSGYASKMFAALNEIPIRMISFGGSNHNVSVLIKRAFKEKALQALNQGLFAR